MDETNDALGVLHLKMWTKALAEMGPAMSRAISAMPVPVPRALSTLSLCPRDGRNGIFEGNAAAVTS